MIYQYNPLTDAEKVRRFGYFVCVGCGKRLPAGHTHQKRCKPCGWKHKEEYARKRYEDKINKEQPTND